MSRPFGRDLTGMDGLDVRGKSPNTDLWHASMKQLISERRPLWTKKTIGKHDGNKYLMTAYERVAYPLLGKSGQVDHVIDIIHLAPATVDHPYERQFLD